MNDNLSLSQVTSMRLPGFEPGPPCEDTALNRACLPIPTIGACYIGDVGFEPTTSRIRIERATRLR